MVSNIEDVQDLKHNFGRTAYICHFFTASELGHSGLRTPLRHGGRKVWALTKIGVNQNTKGGQIYVIFFFFFFSEFRNQANSHMRFRQQRIRLNPLVYESLALSEISYWIERCPIEFSSLAEFRRVSEAHFMFHIRAIPRREQSEITGSSETRTFRFKHSSVQLPQLRLRQDGSRIGKGHGNEAQLLRGNIRQHVWCLCWR